jgi:hypothetical protein
VAEIDCFCAWSATYGPFGHERSWCLALAWVVQWLPACLGGWLWRGQFGVSSELLICYDELWLGHSVTEVDAEGGKPMVDDGHLGGAAC